MTAELTMQKLLSIMEEAELALPPVALVALEDYEEVSRWMEGLGMTFGYHPLVNEGTVLMYYPERAERLIKEGLDAPIEWKWVYDQPNVDAASAKKAWLENQALLLVRGSDSLTNVTMA